MDIKMDKEYLSIKMEITMKGNGNIIKEMGKVFLFGKMAISMMVNGKIIKDKELESLFHKMAAIKVNGLMIKEVV